MKYLQAFWKLFKRRQPKTDFKNHEETGINEKPAHDFYDVDVNQKLEAPSLFIKKQKKVHIQVGIDFGTSATKVVFSQLGRRIFRVVSFNHGLPNYPTYCMPSVGCIGNDGRLLLGVSAAKEILDKEWDTGLQRLKVVIAGKYENSFKDDVTEEKYYNHFKNHKHKPLDPELLTAVYLAYVMQNARKIIRNVPEYRGNELDFAFNICMPIDHIENNSLKTVFENVFKWAELIADEWDKSKKNFNPLKVARYLEKCSLEYEPKVFAVPESVASFASYLVSLRKREGLHAIIDLGAGTTDLSICKLFIDDGKIKTYWYAARNLPEGTIKIERALAQCIALHSKRKKCTSRDICECIINMSSRKREREATIERKLNNIVLTELINFRDSKEYKQTWGSAYRHLQLDQLWKDVEIFVCGGGSNLPHIEKAFSKPWWPNLRTTYSVEKLPVPDNYEPGKSGAPFQRMSVAYGLAIPFPQLEEFTLPEKSPDHTPIPPPIRVVDHEDLYIKD